MLGWLSKLIRRPAAPAVRPAFAMPPGKALFARWPRSPAADLALAREAGAHTLYVLVDRPAPARREAIGPAYAAAAREAGVQLVPWAFCAPGKVAAAAPVLVESARVAGAGYVVLDVEDRHWIPRSVAGDLKRGIDAIKAAGLAVVVTAYGRPWEMPGWSPCLECDGALLQLARTGPSAARLAGGWRASFPTIGTVPQPAMAVKAGLTHAAVIDACAPLAAHMAPWVLDWYRHLPDARAKLSAVIPG